MGTSLALVGAYLLAGELGPANSFDAQARSKLHWQRYATRCGPTSTSARTSPTGVDRYAPNSASDIAGNIAVMKWMQRWPFVRAIASRIWFKVADSIELPDYSTA